MIVENHQQLVELNLMMTESQENLVSTPKLLKTVSDIVQQHGFATIQCPEIFVQKPKNGSMTLFAGLYNNEDAKKAKAYLLELSNYGDNLNLSVDKLCFVKGRLEQAHRYVMGLLEAIGLSNARDDAKGIMRTGMNSYLHGVVDDQKFFVLNEELLHTTGSLAETLEQLTNSKLSYTTKMPYKQILTF